MSRVLRRSSYHYLVRHPWQALLSLLGIALGVAVVVAIDLANQSAGRAFELSMESVTGKATHQVVSGGDGLPDSLYTRLRLELGLRHSAPVLERHVRLADDSSRTLHLLGVDPFAERPFRSYMGDIGSRLDGGIGAFVARPGAAVLLDGTAAELGIEPGDSLGIEVGGRSRSLILAGVISADDERSRQALSSMLITDISVAQEVLGMEGRLTRIDLILPDDPAGKAQLAAIAAMLPAGTRIAEAGSREGAAQQMTAAFRLNLTAMSLLALIVGMFLIYNTMTFSVVQRRPFIGLLRALGVTRGEVFRLVLGEALVLGLLGTAAGLLAGILLGRGMVQLVSQTINDLYFVVSVQSLSLDPGSLGRGLAVGVGATLLSALKPAREATQAPPRLVLSRSGQESDLRRRIPALSLAGALIFLAGIGILAIPSRSIVLSYAGILPLIIGLALMAPLMITLAARLLSPVMGMLFGMLGRMAARGLAAQISRTAVAIAALSIAVSATVGVGTMVTSFRGTVVSWLESRLSADIYISAPSMVARRNDAVLDSAFTNALFELTGIADLNYHRELMIAGNDGYLQVVASHISETSAEGFDWKAGDPARAWPAYRAGEAVLVSEPFAYRRDLDVGDTVTIPSDRGPLTLPIAAIYYNYASEIGVVSIDYDAYRRHWDDPRLSGVSLTLEPGIDHGTMMARIRGLAGGDQEVLVRSNRYLLDTSIAIFDRTFAITNVLHLLAVAVAFIGILSALMALQMERRKELGILRANGLTPRQLWGLTTLQTALMGLVAGVLAIPMGIVLAVCLIYVINLRSFGWTLQFALLPEFLVQAVALALLAALLAGLYPAWRMARSSPALALRGE